MFKICVIVSGVYWCLNPLFSKHTGNRIKFYDFSILGWKWECSLKIKLFNWLLIEDKVLSWKNLQKRGWQGPGICCLCKNHGESTKRIFWLVIFPEQFGRSLKKLLDLGIRGNGASVVDSFKNWNLQNQRLTSLSYFVCWYTWTDRNRALFEGSCPSLHRVVYLSRRVLEHL